MLTYARISEVARRGLASVTPRPLLGVDKAADHNGTRAKGQALDGFIAYIVICSSIARFLQGHQSPDVSTRRVCFCLHRQTYNSFQVVHHIYALFFLAILRRIAILTLATFSLNLFQVLEVDYKRSPQSDES